LAQDEEDKPIVFSTAASFYLLSGADKARRVATVDPAVAENNMESDCSLLLCDLQSVCLRGLLILFDSS
jgi:hypothetical protein